MPLTSTIRQQIVVLVAFSFTCFLTNFIMLAVIIRHRGEIKNSMASALSCNLLLGGLIFGLIVAIINMDKLVNNYIHQTGDFLCQLEGVGNTLGGGATIVGNVLIAAERYLVIFRNHRMTPKEVFKLSVAAWTWILILAILPIVLPDGPYVLQSSGVYCLTEWWGTKPSAMAEVYLSALTCIGALIFIGYVYGSIAFKVHIKRKTLNSMGMQTAAVYTEDFNNVYGPSKAKLKESSASIGEAITSSWNDDQKDSVKPPTTSTVSQKDRQIYIKVMCMASGYIFFWGPYAIVLATGIFGRAKVHPTYCIVAALMAGLNAIVNAAIIGWLDPLHKRFLLEELRRISCLFRLANLAPASDTGVV